MGGRQEESQPRIKNKLPAPVQITAEQLIREASERIGERTTAHPIGQNTEEYRQRERRRHEDAIRRSRSNMSIYQRYAKWEEEQNHDMARARSIYERAVSQDPTSHPVWLAYGEAEMRRGNIQLARNVWDRACTILPRHDQFWYKRLAMEEAHRDFKMARSVWLRWIEWEPDLNAWRSFVKFEQRQRDPVRVRLVYEQMLVCHYDKPEVWLEYAKFELTQKRQFAIERARAIFERACHCLPIQSSTSFLIEFAKFEAKQNEVERARAIYTWAMNAYPDSDTVRHSYVIFEKQYGDPAMVNDVVVERRRRVYERRVVDNPHDYDAWFDLLRIEEDLYRVVDGDADRLSRVRDAYERAIASVPDQHAQKADWRRYVYFWLFYAVFEEQSAMDASRAISILKTFLSICPYPFAKVYKALASVYIRSGDLKMARMTLGQAIGKHPLKKSLWLFYIDQVEMRVHAFDRVRLLYERWLEYTAQDHPDVWLRFAELERALGEEERCRAIYELAVDNLLMCDLSVWMAYIEWEWEENGNLEKARALYERLLNICNHPSVWIGFARMEISTDDGVASMRKVMKRAVSVLPAEDKIIIITTWRELEQAYNGDPDLPDSCANKEDESGSNLIAMAKKWKQSLHD